MRGWKQELYIGELLTNGTGTDVRMMISNRRYLRRHLADIALVDLEGVYIRSRMHIRLKARELRKMLEACHETLKCGVVSALRRHLHSRTQDHHSTPSRLHFNDENRPSQVRKCATDDLVRDPFCLTTMHDS